MKKITRFLVLENSWATPNLNIRDPWKLSIHFILSHKFNSQIRLFLEVDNNFLVSPLFTADIYKKSSGWNKTKLFEEVPFEILDKSSL